MEMRHSGNDPNSSEFRGYFPTLDGWRCIAVLIVVFSHDNLYSAGLLNTNWFHEHGIFGVQIFFGISGLLICSRILQDERAHGRISLKAFYIRRAFRILPPLLGYLVVIAALAMAHVIPLTPREWLASLFFFKNYGFLANSPGHNAWYTGHFWSLAVEEHFYLMLPAFLLFVPKRWRLRGLLFVSLVVIGWRLFIQATRPNVDWPQHTDTNLDYLLIPAMFAVVLAHPRGLIALRRISSFWIVSGAIVAALVTMGRYQMITPILEAILIPLTLLGTVLHPGAFFSRILEFSALRWIGKISYSLYLWQQLFFSGFLFHSATPLGMLNRFPWRWFALFACASASYYLLEKPMIKLGHRIAPPATPGREEKATSLPEKPVAAAPLTKSAQLGAR